LCDRFAAAMSSQAAKTIKSIKRIRAKWEGVQARRVVNSEIKTLARILCVWPALLQPSPSNRPRRISDGRR
jgi:hypothetical protein